MRMREKRSNTGHGVEQTSNRRSAGTPAAWPVVAVLGLFGSAFGQQPEWDLLTTSLPSGRYGHSMAYDSARHVTVLFGGTNASTYFNQTWEWNGSSWAQLSPANPPSGRSGAGMAYDSSRGVTVLFGGSNADGRNRETWEWNGSTWTNRNPSLRPTARYQHAMAYDSARGVTVLFGGYTGTQNNETWEWNGSTWTNRTPSPPSPNPTARSAAAMVYDTSRHVTVLFGGTTASGSYSNETWEWNGSSWMQRSGGTAPLARSRHAMAYDASRDVTVLFGGYDSVNYFADTWEWNGSTWTQRSVRDAPGGRYLHAMAYDGSRSVAVLFGGCTGPTGYSDETWKYGVSGDALLGDLNCDGVVNVADVSPFVKALINPATYQSEYPACDILHADMNGDGTVNGKDVQSFINELVAT
ncbi:MAG TPA: dockerin type I repeat-containing protein [Phycisphaerae bacterium]|nr:dockerin type I repeat-containing protein [Phycisphaerae bacterium]